MANFSMMEANFWRGKRVFLTGHTGFKGAWLTLWLTKLGAEVTGYALKPPTRPSLFELCGIERDIRSVEGDIRSGELLTQSMKESNPEIVIHMAAQPLLRESYRNPADTFATNVMGTVNLFEAARSCHSLRAIVNVTTDKCYENKEWEWGYREEDQLGGFDPYSSSKACSELVTSAYRNSFFPSGNYDTHGVAVATARAGNVIGGGDWAHERLIPDILHAFNQGKRVIIRNPNAIRPWQHVLEPLSGYMRLAECLYNEGTPYATSWNFGPDEQGAATVEQVVSTLASKWGNGAAYDVIPDPERLHEAHYLKLDCSKARMRLGWSPRWTLNETLDRIVEWNAAYRHQSDMKRISEIQIERFEQSEAVLHK